MKIGIVGLGLIGGSLGRAIIKNTKHKVYGYDTDGETMKTASVIRAIDGELTDKKVKEIDILFIALYPIAIEQYFKKYCGVMKDGAIIVDLCGNKRDIVGIMKEYATQYPNLTFIGGHPMAGREFTGIKHSTSTLFDRASMIVTNVNASLSQMQKLKAFCMEVGFGSMVITTAEEHDRIIAYTSQLAHVVSSAYIKNQTSVDHVGFSAGSFRDMTRVARLSAEMWTELMMENKDNLLREIDEFMSYVQEYRDTIANSDEEKMKSLLQDGTDRKLYCEKLRSKLEVNK